METEPMAKMTPEQQGIYERGEDQDGPDRSPVPEGYYLLKVISDDEYKGEEYDGVNLKFEVQSPRGYKGKWLWDRMSYSPKAVFRWRMLFEATGYEHDSDTAELVEAGELVVAFVSQGIQEKGKNKGQVVNNIDEYFEPSDENRALVND